VFQGQKPGVYNSWGVCIEYILSFSGAVYRSYFTRLEAVKAYAAFLEQQNKDEKFAMIRRFEVRSLECITHGEFAMSIF
jgi:viroplasmin and RNaseH domain-containing protein